MWHWEQERRVRTAEPEAQLGRVTLSGDTAVNLGACWLDSEARVIVVSTRHSEACVSKIFCTHSEGYKLGAILFEIVELALFKIPDSIFLKLNSVCLCEHILEKFDGLERCWSCIEKLKHRFSVSFFIHSFNPLLVSFQPSP